MQTVKSMPDVVESKDTQFERVIDWVGMSSVEASLRVQGGVAPCEVDVFVDLADPKAKGIHMSRLYLAVSEELKSQELSKELIYDLLVRLIAEQQGKSVQSKLKIKFNLSMMRKALVSQTFGERHYPIEVEATAIKVGDGYHFDMDVSFKVLYSSTCPCSAALSRQLIQENWANFASGKESVSAEEVSSWLKNETSMVATPHAQRSEAHIILKPSDFNEALVKDWIENLERNVLKTPVQTAVKREDEQEFARLNGTNLMFCEDAARRVAGWLDNDSEISAYWARMEHRESLHSHNAVSEISNNWGL
ncbi:MAG: GTP cyclohydrolase FolE2 [Bdellovibrionales bacterium]